MKKIAITTSSFGKDNPAPLALLKQHGLEGVLNPHGRPLRKEEIGEFLNGCPAVIAGTELYDEQTLRQLSGLKVISRVGVGIDNIDVTAAGHLGIQVFNTPDAPTRAVAELVIGLILNLLRQVSVMDRGIRQNQWPKQMGRLFHGKTLGIIGFGRIGQAVGDLAKVFGAKVYFYDPYIKTARSTAEQLELEQLLSISDILSVHLPYNNETSNMLNTRCFELIKNGSYLVNCSRGGIVDEGALVDALQSKKIAGAALDVFKQEPYQGPLQNFDNVILTPHIGSYALETRVEMEVQAVENLLKGLNILR